MIAFGPVPSRRLGQSLGINNIPPKVCTYACAYCQLGRTIRMQAQRREFYEPKDILRDVEAKLRKADEAGERIDYLTLVPDGEPTLDINLAHELSLLKSLGVRIAVITNASLLWHEDVREALCQADWVSLKVDSTEEEVWRQVDRPHGKLHLDTILKGMLEFARVYKGELATETMLIKGVNEDTEHLQRVAGYLAWLQPATAYLAIPTRPPAENWVRPAKEAAINRAYQIYRSELEHVELLVGYEGNAFAFTGNVEEDLLDITAVHPMREEAVDEFLDRSGADWSTIHSLLARDQLVQVGYGGQTFFMRNLS